MDQQEREAEAAASGRGGHRGGEIRANARLKGTGARGQRRGETFSSGPDSESEEEDMDEEGTDSESHRAPSRNPQRHASKRPRSHADTTDSSD
ncbi:hypothetical protein DUNSADRAFT_7576 [Dunaliella salina]|uniref:Uncharacterized protein n=1 Tax=Dunaliella salina TaxID=3046 RepID=A0ABQ7GL08_DUNSA|nr:hypothetical protein DUNSADRAFT_7576 [Dunaliella salina]|eukprot:KAF5835296.1 hypothetical protein DUNSADRAFT_7576 [Dunaliella salina]